MNIDFDLSVIPPPQRFSGACRVEDHWTAVHTWDSPRGLCAGTGIGAGLALSSIWHKKEIEILIPNGSDTGRSGTLRQDAAKVAVAVDVARLPVGGMIAKAIGSFDLRQRARHVPTRSIFSWNKSWKTIGGRFYVC